VGGGRLIAWSRDASVLGLASLESGHQLNSRCRNKTYSEVFMPSRKSR
jgi:hypothetical protein